MGRALRVGVPGGIIAGTLMAVWSMAAMWITGHGFWTPLNLIAHTFYRAAPLDGTFSASALLVGLTIHLTLSGLFGTTLAVIAQRMPGSRSVVIAGGILFVAIVWPVMQWEIWYRIDETAAEGFSDWIFAVAHLMFGVTAAALASLAFVDDESAKRGRHAAGRKMPPPEPAPGSLFQPNRGQFR
jgi:hypothetical protein